MAKVILGLGTNIGERIQHLARALEYIESLALSDCQYSDVYESPALLLPGSPKEWNQPFLNMVVCGSTDYTAQELLRVVKEIEQRMDRQDRGKWAPREIDIDILSYDEQTLVLENLIIPHPEMLRRDFVLLPLLDIEPTWKHPATQKTAYAAYQGLSEVTVVKSEEATQLLSQSMVAKVA